VLKEVSYSHPETAEVCLKKINLSIDYGEFVVLAGPSGCGKSTLCLLLNGIIPQSIKGGKLDGKITVAGLDTQTCPTSKLSEHIGLVFQNPDNQLFCLRVDDEVAFGLENRAVPRQEMIRRVDGALRSVGLSNLKNKFTFAISGGQKQRLAIADNIAADPKIMVLDEPTSDLDPLGASDILSTIKKLQENGLTILVIEHRLEELAPLADRILIMNQGEIILDKPPRELFKNHAILRSIGVAIPQSMSMLPQRIITEPHPITYDEVKETVYGYLKQKDIRRVAANLLERQFNIGEAIIRMDGVSYQYPDGTFAIKGVDLEIQEGDFVAIIGQNGSGKSTLAKLLMGLIKPTKGMVLIDRLDTRKVDLRELSTRIGFVFQNPDNQLFTRRVWDEIAFSMKIMKSPIDINQRVSEVLNIIGMMELRDRHPQALSRGERRRLAVGTAMSLHQKIIILDEPTTGQDYGHSRKLIEFIGELNLKGLTFIMITHDMSLVAEFARRTIVLKDGKILLDGPTREVFSQVEKLEETKIRPPTVSQLSTYLREKGIDIPLLLTPNEMLLALEKCVREVEN
jgi:energy-coupling factor transport system ATP-binding protein